MLDPDSPSNPAEQKFFADAYWDNFLRKEKRKRRRRSQMYRLLMTLVWLGVPLLVIVAMDYLKTLSK